jgi:hypothetical protein
MENEPESISDRIIDGTISLVKIVGKCIGYYFANPIMVEQERLQKEEPITGRDVARSMVKGLALNTLVYAAYAVLDHYLELPRNYDTGFYLLALTGAVTNAGSALLASDLLNSND